MKNTIKSRAKAAGDKYYRSGKKCKYGHMGDRYVGSGGCCECYKIDVIKRRTKKSKDAPIGRRNVSEDDFIIVGGKETYKEMCKRVYKRDISW